MTAGTAVAADLTAIRQYLQEHDIRYVVFDMDLTVTSEHSGGMLLKMDRMTLFSYMDSARDTDALAVIQLCAELGIRMGVATFQKEVDDAAHVGGTPLVRQALQRLGIDAIEEGSIVALTREEYKVMVTNQDTYNKNDMLRTLFERWGVEFDPTHTLLVDDTVRNIRAFASIGGHGLAIHGHSGMQLDNVTFVSPASAT
ncbi:hypothetical protein JKP88DRAFT_334774 [Tribonema minus]|uniref:Uncharacterized protein n=1 Tax=Tribonema minus TaxID=303371 RepID=A0A835YLM2_9STRA|nr:hypothetical protein JKP88DRAFT_334774 [Tribonema minus]